MALPPAASGNRSSSSTIAASLRLPGATKSSANPPPAVPARPMATAAATAQAPIVAHGLRALASPIRRVTRCMRCSLRRYGRADGYALGGAVAPTLAAPLSGVARREAGWRSPAGGVVGRRQREVSPSGGGGPIRRKVDDRAPPLAYREAMPADHPRRFQGPFARWPRAADAALAAAVFLETVFVTDGPGDSLVTRPIGDVPIPALLAFAVPRAALYWRRRAPLAVLAVALVAWASTIGSGYADLGWGAI